ncbi:MAG: RsmB/NOP family class I SAM-dependent RNA methyltransferase [Bdellovibrionales bacterium]
MSDASGPSKKGLICHRPIWEGLLHALHEILVEHRPADKVIQYQMKAHKQWGRRDRGLFAEAVYGVVRWRRRLLYAAGVDEPALDGPSLQAMALVHLAQHGIALGKGIPITPIDWQTVRGRYENPPSRAVAESIPDWLDQVGFQELGAQWDQILPALNVEAPVFLRTNRLKTTPQKLVKELEQEGLACQIEVGDTLRLSKRTNVFLTESFRQGHFEVQDLHSQQAALALDVQPGQRVVDACAGAGGKTLQLASLMGNRGKIIALDVVQKKLTTLRERSNRAGASIIETRLIESSKVIKRMQDSADRVLLDVPCTGLGVLRRNPDSKWHLSPEELTRLNLLQSKILEDYSSMCRVGGRLVYATCSILPSEDSHVVDGFLNRHGDQWKCLKQNLLVPTPTGGDGFFVAVLERMSS